MSNLGWGSLAAAGLLGVAGINYKLSSTNRQPIDDSPENNQKNPSTFSHNYFPGEELNSGGQLDFVSLPLNNPIYQNTNNNGLKFKFTGSRRRRRAKSRSRKKRRSRSRRKKRAPRNSRSRKKK